MGWLSGVFGDPVLFVYLIALGLTAGVISTVVSLASVVSYPALLAMGLPPVTANVTNTVALLFTGLGAATGSRQELKGQGRRVAALGLLAGLGGSVGALILLRTSSRSFESAVPVLIALASVAILLQPWLSKRLRTVDGPPSRLWALGVVSAAVYTGYFGAAGGVLQLAALGGLLREELVRLNALKNVIGGMANAMAALGFAVFGPVRWDVALPLAVGFLCGGWLGPGVARRLPVTVFRPLIAGSALVVACVLAARTYT
jgi:uncharacterized membrane protein YfcA